MAAHDLPVMKAADCLVSAAYLEQRSLDRRTKELLFILSLTVMRAERHHIASHLRVALQQGVTPREILEAIEIALPEAGVVAFQHGFDVCCEVFGATGIDRSAEVMPANRPVGWTRRARRFTHCDNRPDNRARRRTERPAAEGRWATPRTALR